MHVAPRSFALALECSPDGTFHDESWYTLASRIVSLQLGPGVQRRRLAHISYSRRSRCGFQELRKQCQDFATALLDYTRSSNELGVLLNHDPTGPAFEDGERMHLNRLKLAIKLRQKKVTAMETIHVFVFRVSVG